jgi:hypothetical protein
MLSQKKIRRFAPNLRIFTSKNGIKSLSSDRKIGKGMESMGRNGRTLKIVLKI